MAGQWDWFYRFKQFRQAGGERLPPNATRRLLTDSLGSRSAALFHGLNQRLPKRGFRRQVATFHDLFVLSGDYSTAEFRARFAAQARDAAASADRIVAVSEFTAGQVAQYLNYPRDRIRVIHHGVLPRAIPDLPRENVVLCVGAIQKRKNQAALVRAFRAMPPDWKLVLAGSSGFGAEETLDAIAASRCADRIRVTGYISDEEVGRWYARARIFAFPSLDEGFGMPVLEAMAAGVPVIAGNRSALPEVAGDAGVGVDPLREDELAEALAMLARDEGRRSDLAERGRIRAAGFTWRRAVAETAAVYSELL